MAETNRLPAPPPTHPPTPRLWFMSSSIVATLFACVLGVNNTSPKIKHDILKQCLCLMTRWRNGNAPPCQVGLVPFQACERISSPPPPPPQHVLTSHNVGQRAPRRGHEFECGFIWNITRVQWRNMHKTSRDLRATRTLALKQGICSSNFQPWKLKGSRYLARRFPGPPRTSAWPGWLSPFLPGSAVC